MKTKIKNKNVGNAFPNHESPHPGNSDQTCRFSGHVPNSPEVISKMRQSQEARKEVILEASRLMRKLNLQAYIRGEYPEKSGSFGIERALQEYIERRSGHGRMALIAGMVALREKRVSTIPPKEFSGTEPMAEGIQIK